MFLARVEGSVVATKKDEGLIGRKLLLVRPQLVDESDPARFRPGKNTIVAVDSVGAGEGNWCCSPRAVPLGWRPA